MRSDRIDAARRIGARLTRDAVWLGERCNWFAPHHDSLTGRHEEAVCTLGPTIYDGTAGIALFLLELGLATGDPVFATTARGAATHAMSRACDVLEPMRCGFYTGRLGIGCAAIRVGRACSDDGLVADGLATASGAFDGGVAAAMSDVVSGLAGAIPPLLWLSETTGDRRWRELALEAGDALLGRAAEDARGMSWDTMHEMDRALDSAGLGGHMADPAGKPHLTGLSHGAGGIAVALLALEAWTGERRFGRAARRGFDYEDGWFDAMADGWPDLRRDEGHRTPVSAWCHGAAGIGLARLCAFRLTREDRFRHDVSRCLRVAGRSIEAGLARGTANFSLCHGVAGDAELFLLAAREGGWAEARPVAEAVADHGLRTFALTGAAWPSGAPGNVETPGLMLGLAGTGYFYLRTCEELDVPSVLLFDPAPRA